METTIVRRNGLITAEQAIELIKTKVEFYRCEGDLYTAIIRLSKYYYGRRRTELTDNEMKLYDVLLKNHLKPDTIYTYLRMYMVKDDVKYRYKKGLLTKKQMLLCGLNELRRQKTRKFLSVLEDSRKLFLELDWR